MDYHISSWQVIALLLAAPLCLIGYRISEWIDWDSQLKQEELRGMEAHHHQRYAEFYKTLPKQEASND